ncbi:M24 family metallopeptidase [Halalkalibacter alkaliphilus]|uniref:Xaa-Pro peptidase family protein n=1 Tax=Halalkalibacter alkaliphilus TaxID=2917993 RepID=A0A9X2I5W2_9BACI|nr:Xaa-Pro peptidase family protein [Halalkalibacter alkaliphilus]MCL7748552.1 Xaa-Pro peptidase family protein [Halalkalibacter alkaliphilus]
MIEEKEWRFSRIRRAMLEQEMDGLLAYAPGWRRENVRYITGGLIRSSFALAYLPIEGRSAFFSTLREDLHATEEQGRVEDSFLLSFPDCHELINRLKDGGAPKKLGIAHLELMPKLLLNKIQESLPTTTIVSATKLMDQVRLVKSNWELEQIRRAGVVCSAGWEAFVAALKPGATEFEIVANVEAELKRLGAQDNFMLIASGGKEVMGMTPPGNRQLQEGDMVRTELTPQLDGYYAQICRSAVLGEPNEGQNQSFKLFKEALEAGLSVVKAGVTAHEVAVAENDVFRKYGFGEYCTSQYTRVRGHAHGLHPDEAPAIIEGNDMVLEENAVIIVHPNTYTPLAGYHVLGDPVVVTKDGYEPLLTTERALFTASV